MEQEVEQSCLKGSFPFQKEPEKSGKSTGNRNKSSSSNWSGHRRVNKERLSAEPSVRKGLSSFITCLYSPCHGGDLSDVLQVLLSMQGTSLTASS